MPLINIRTPDDGSDWTDERLAMMKTGHLMIDGETYPITDAKADGNSSLLTVDTGDVELPAGTKTDAGTVE